MTETQSPSQVSQAASAKKPNAFLKFVAPAFAVGLVVGLFGGALLAPIAEGISASRSVSLPASSSGGGNTARSATNVSPDTGGPVSTDPVSVDAPSVSPSTTDPAAPTSTAPAPTTPTPAPTKPN